MNSVSRGLATTAGVVLFLAGCGTDPVSRTAATTPTTAAPTAEAPPPIVASDDPLGSGPPAVAAGEFDMSVTWAIAGTAERDSNGCWWVNGDGDRALFLAPTGTELGDTGDVLVIDGTVITEGAPLDIDGAVLYGIDELPGGAEGRWGTYLAFCEAPRPMVVLANTVRIPGDSDLEEAAAELAGIGAALFDTHHGCGYGFATGSADQRWALRIWVNQSDTIAAGTITLPDDRFVAVVEVGRRLFANYCDDVDEWFEPDPVVTAAWPIIAGSFDYPGSDGTGDCTQGAVTTTLITAVVDVDGTPVDLAPVTIENRSFGCFAG